MARNTVQELLNQKNSTTRKSIQECLNSLCGFTGTSHTEQECWNHLAGTTGRTSQEAANLYCGTSKMTIQDALHHKLGLTI